MEENTKTIIIKLKSCSTREEMLQIINHEHAKVKNLLELNNIEICPDFSQHIQGGQRIVGLKLIMLISDYEEINFIRIGMEREWTILLEEKERFYKIKAEIDDIFEK